MKSKLRYVGLDVHVDSITVAVADDGGEARSQPDKIVSPPAMRPNCPRYQQLPDWGSRGFPTGVRQDLGNNRDSRPKTHPARA